MQIQADMHIHSVASTHAYSTVTEIAAAAAELGLKAVALTDHGCALPDAPHIWHFDNLRIIPDMICGVRVYRGVEANILNTAGEIDIPKYALDRLEWVVASMHLQTAKFSTQEEVTEAWLNVAKNPYVDVIGHCGTPQYVFDYERVIPEFGRNGKIVEINNASFLMRKNSVDHCREIARLCKKYEVPVIVDSDAHYHALVGRVDRALHMLEEIDFPQELIMNLDYNRILKYIEKRNRAYDGIV
ncbi:MAG: phosphatase [Clostridiales bacterium]|nr:phosphatase [Clostridiales bacterium]